MGSLIVKILSIETVVSKFIISFHTKGTNYDEHF